MERIAPALTDKSVPFTLPKMNDAMEAYKAANSVLIANSEGEPDSNGPRVMGLIDSDRRTLKLTEIEERLQTLENAY